MLMSLRHLEKSYPQGPSTYHVLRQITLDIAAGEFVSIMGPSGAGKSTLLHILGMHDAAWTGEYHFLDEPVHRLNPKRRAQLHKAHIGFVFQSYHLLDDLTVADPHTGTDPSAQRRFFGVDHSGYGSAPRQGDGLAHQARQEIAPLHRAAPPSSAP